MKILVIDDTERHRNAAVQTLSPEHDVTVCESVDEALEVLRQQEYGEWDAVLCDLLMPAGGKAQGGPGLQYVGQEMPVGWALAIVAATMGAKYVAVVTDTNHHHHPTSEMIDSIRQHVFTINNAHALFTNAVSFVNIAGTDDKGKDWADILRTVMKEPSTGIPGRLCKAGTGILA